MDGPPHQFAELPCAVDVGQVVLEDEQHLATVVVGRHAPRVLERVISSVAIPRMLRGLLNREDVRRLLALKQNLMRPRQRVHVIVLGYPAGQFLTTIIGWR